MWMGRERGIIRWDIHFSLLTMRLRRAEAALQALGERENGNKRARLEAEVRDLQRQLNALGPSPRAKMG